MGKQRKTKNIDLTVGNITSSLWKFAVPLMLGNVLQQLYNLVDTWVVGHYIGDNALAAVGSSYTLMTFLTSIVIGLCLGSSAFLSMAYGKKDQDLIRNGIFISAVVIGSLEVILTGIIYIWMNPMIRLLQVPQETTTAMREYLFYVFIGFFATFLYNYVANVLRGIGNSVTPLFPSIFPYCSSMLSRQLTSAPTSCFSLFNRLSSNVCNNAIIFGCSANFICVIESISSSSYLSWVVSFLLTCGSSRQYSGYFMRIAS